MEFFLAHITEDCRKQTVLQHLESTAQRCSTSARAFCAAEQGELAGLAHDLGKYSNGFQNRLLHDGRKVDHATAGAFGCFKLGQPYAAFAVAGHHSGLPDGGSQTDPPDSSSFFGRMNRAFQGRLPEYAAWQSELTLPTPPLPNAIEPQMEGMFFTRMLFSCLVDADYSDTAEFMANSPHMAYPNISMDTLMQRLQNYISGWFPPKGELNTQRCSILEQCIQKGERRAPGLYTLTVPTGGGKTVASLAFALSQAKAQGLSRIIYVIPYTSIIEQTTQKFREILGEDYVLEHHSGVLYDMDQEATPESSRLARATETWDMPVIVTTAVQFFESLFSCRPSQCRKLHNIAQSVIVFDEAQMLPLPYLRPCVWSITQLVKHYRVSAVLCTATQPALTPIFQEFAPELPVTELCPPEQFLWDVFRRVTFRQAGRMTYEELATQLQEQDQVLCIVNSRKSAQEIFLRLEGEGCFHLSTLMYPAHRRAKLEEIRRRLDKGLPCRVVSTSLIEAGVDVDFPAVYREEAGLDSILQAAGRCNREGKRPLERSIVTVFQGEGSTPPLFATAVGAGRDAMAHYEDITSPEAVHAYFTRLLDLKGAEAQDVQQILPLMQSELFPFRTVSERFHLIDSPTVTVYIPKDEGAGLVERLRSGEHSRNLYRQLGQYGVSIYEQHFNALDQAGDLERLEDGSVILSTPDLYSEYTGLSLKADSGKGLFI